ncbi:hypothetical protein BO85DRAFT_277681 [Aspergillus piperis CBS 112811]|uniref:Uncharacterized protein n=1 Tax=Aspergillus piperis CBS 112811 TaxID=1448313 RepID=A0A8G1R4Z9_9EURO|nr:hypothetical protein BO85DRAFT_277681 [Aspergillus piperis CBS 112811]RAH58602.1 hypothetical protein BO85DRAFT_277681 [Aspergillus piperis CBS 112811]
MALHRSGSYLSLSFCSQFLSVHFCLSSFCHVPFPLLFLFSITTYISLLFFFLLLAPFPFFLLPPNFLISGDVSISFSKAFSILLPAISTECSHFHTISYCIPLVSFVELSLQLHDPSKFKYLATSCQKVASMVPTARGGSRVLSVIVNLSPSHFFWHILVSLGVCVCVCVCVRPQCVSITEIHIALYGSKIKAELRKPTDTHSCCYSRKLGCLIQLVVLIHEVV